MLFFKYLIVSEQANLGRAWTTQTSGLAKKEEKSKGIFILVKIQITPNQLSF
jgi:hypothetical protein